MKILITGGSGFIGTNLMEHYLAMGATVLNIDFQKPRNPKHQTYWKECDIRDYGLLQKLAIDFGPDYILHMAATTGLAGRNLDDYSSNTIGVENMLKLSQELITLKKAVFTSTMLVCKAGYYPKHDEDYCATTLYGHSKIIGERRVRNSGKNLRWAIIRPASIWGPWFGWTYREFFISIYKRRYVNFSGGMCLKTYGYIGNVVYQIDQILKSEASDFRTLYVGDYIPTKIDEWAIEIASEFGTTIHTIPRSLIRLAAYFGDYLGYFKVRLPMNSFRLANMTTDNVIDLALTKSIAPETKFSRVDGNRETINWLREHEFIK